MKLLNTSQKKKKDAHRPILLLWAVLILWFGIGQISDNVLKPVSIWEENGEQIYGVEELIVYSSNSPNPTEKLNCLIMWKLLFIR